MSFLNLRDFTVRTGLFLLFIFLIISSTHAQDIPSKTFPVFYDSDGWTGSQNFINSLLIDQENVLWLATNNGLVRWNGQRKLRYSANAINQKIRIPGSDFRKIIEYNDHVFVTHLQGEQVISKVDKHKAAYQQVPFLNSDHQNVSGNLSGFIKSNDNRLFTTRNHKNQVSIFEYSNGGFQQILQHQFDTDIENKATHLVFNDGFFLLAIAEHGIWKINSQKSEKIFDLKPFNKNKTKQIYFLTKDSDERVWLGLNDKENIFQWSGTKNTFEPFTSPSPNLITKLIEDQHHHLLFVSGTYPQRITNLHLFSDDKFTDYTSLLNPTIKAIFSSPDFTKSLLTVTNDNVNFLELQSKKIKSFLDEKKPEDKWGKIIMGIQESNDGDIYFLAEDTYFYQLKKGTDAPVEIPIIDQNGNQVSFNCGGTIKKDQNGLLWFKSCINENNNGSLVSFDPKTQAFMFFPFKEKIRDIDLDEHQRIWLTHNNNTEKNGELSYFSITDQSYTTLDLGDFPESRICYHDNDSTIWLGTQNGLLKVNPITAQSILLQRENASFTHNNIIAIEKNHKGELLLGTYGGGLMVYHPKTKSVQTFTNKDGLTQDYVCGIIQDDDTHYWISTFDGLSYWDTENNLFTNFNKIHGISHSEFNRYAYLKSSDTTCYFGSVQGVNYFKTKALIKDQASPTLELSAITKYYGKQDTLTTEVFGLKNKNEITLSPDLTFVQFDFCLNRLTQNDQNKIYTKLENYDDDWALTDEKQSVRYRLLPPGDYTLHVKAFDARGIPAKNKLTISITAKQYFYNNNWFWIGLLALLMTGLFFLYKHQIKRIKRTAVEKQNTNRRFAELELTALQAQLNPHFIFNALGAIQYYIQVNDVDAADTYLTRFAQLMRKYLDGSKEKFISLKKEIELLKIYTELEQLRFDHIFKVEIKMAKGLELEEILLPGMMVQPFVENAINHGLSPRKDGHGLLSIHFYKFNDQLICEISDNGIGIENAQRNRRKGHKSRGMNILDEKIQTMKLSKIMDIQKTVTTLDSSKKDYPGTKVRLGFDNIS